MVVSFMGLKTCNGRGKGDWFTTSGGQMAEECTLLFWERFALLLAVIELARFGCKDTDSVDG